MKFKDEIINILGKVNSYGFYITKQGGYVEGVYKLIDFKNDKIELVVYGDKLIIEGENLSVGKYTDGDFSFFGKISSISIKNKEV